MTPGVHRLGLIGNPENRRVRHFVEAMTARGLPRPPVVSWMSLLRDEYEWNALERAETWRIDSAGEDEAVTHELIRLGGGSPDARLAFGEIDHLRELHAGFAKLLQRLESRDTKWQAPPSSILAMFDKWVGHERFVAAGLPRPESQRAPTDLAAFRAERREQRSGRIFLKPYFSSSASGTCALRWSGDREQLIAPIQLQVGDDGRLRFFNSLRVRSYARREDIDAILAHLLPQGMIQETWLPKARLDGLGFDLRILVIDGEARHVVVRQSRHPMTNLHLGNRRGDLGALRDSLGNDALQSCRDLAEQAAACFPDALHAGIDVLLTPQGRPFVVEINAFGDLLPGLRHRGQTTYEAILEASLACSRAA